MGVFSSDHTTRQVSVHQKFFLLLAAFSMLSGCMTQSSPPKTTHYYTLNYDSPGNFFKQQLPITLRVERFSVSPPFHTQRIIYAGEGTHRNAYAYHQWISAPGDLLPYFFVRDLRKANGFKAVLTPDTTLSATHSLHGWVEEFIEIDDSSKWKAVATIHISLINKLNPDPTQKIMLQKRYHTAVNCKSKTPEGFAEAMGKAVAKITTTVAKDIHHRLSTTSALTY